LAALGRSQLDVGNAGVVVNGDVGVLPASPAAAPDTVVQDAFTDVPEAALLAKQPCRLSTRQIVDAGQPNAADNDRGPHPGPSA
jgi:hypothetical protein